MAKIPIVGEKKLEIIIKMVPGQPPEVKSNASVDLTIAGLELAKKAVLDMVGMGWAQFMEQQAQAMGATQKQPPGRKGPRKRR